MGSETIRSDAALVQIVQDAYSAKAKLGANDSCTNALAFALAVDR